jgi:hypothetical protein
MKQPGIPMVIIVAAEDIDMDGAARGDGERVENVREHLCR